jgi:hypothetical protein
MRLAAGQDRCGDENAGCHEHGVVAVALAAPETFEFAVEWHSGGIGLSIVEFDGGAIAATAQRAVPYWPESPQSG